jgi:hypothetical protein
MRLSDGCVAAVVFDLHSLFGNLWQGLLRAMLPRSLSYHGAAFWFVGRVGRFPVVVGLR